MALIGNTYTLVDAEARLNIGLFKGLSLSPFVGFAVVRDAYVPEIGTVELLGDWNFSTPDMLRGTVRYAQYDLNGVKLGLDVAYKLRSVAEVKAGYMFTPQGKGERLHRQRRPRGASVQCGVDSAPDQET